MSEETNVTQNEGQQQEESAKTYTQEEVDKLLQSESDRRVTEALKKQEAKNQERVREAEKLAKMNEQDKYVYQLEQREKAIAEKEHALALSENKNAASKILSEKGISLDLVDMVVADDADTMNENIKKLEKAFKASVRLEVERRMGQSVPNKNLHSDDVITKADFKKMSLAQQNELYRTQPELYAELIK